jgi:(p)ppGpp synthase/HD superfamily hydrolase
MDALTIATVAHAGQRDKAGVPYIEHPKGVAVIATNALISGADGGLHIPNRATGAYNLIRDAALLHDVVEDTSVTPEGLIELGVSPETVRIVLLLTYDKTKMTRDQYYAQIKTDPVARLVKISDVRHNLGRLAYLTPEDYERLTVKYTHALEILL